MRKLYVAIAILGIHLIIAAFADLIAPYDPSEIVNLPYQPPSKEHLLGTDRLGRDILSQLLHGSRLSILIGVSVGALMTLFSTTIGMLAGYYGGVVDRVLSTLTDVFLVIPGLPLMIVISAYVRVRGPLVVILVIALTSWGGGARIIRSQVMSLRNRDFVMALKSIGESNFRIMFFEVLPNMFSLIVANFFSAVLYGILGEASLSFLGLSDVSKITWGTMLYWAQSANALLNGMWYWVLAPGVAIASLGTAFALLNFYVDELTNPRLRRS